MDDGEPLAEELVLGSAQTDPFGAMIPSDRCVFGRVGVGPNRHLAGADLVGPAEDFVHLGRNVTVGKVDGTQEHLAGGPVEADDVALMDDRRTDREVSGRR